MELQPDIIVLKNELITDTLLPLFGSRIRQIRDKVDWIGLLENDKELAGIRAIVSSSAHGRCTSDEVVPSSCILQYHQWVENILKGTVEPPVTPFSPASLIDCDTKENRWSVGIRRAWHAMLHHDNLPLYSAATNLTTLEDTLRRRLAVKMSKLNKAENEHEPFAYSRLEDAYIRYLMPKK